jgi:hypothetical protein
MSIRNYVLAAGVAASLVAGAGIGHARLAADLATAAPPPAVRYVDPPTEWPTRGEAERWYYTHSGPSVAWQHATPTERAYAERSYLADWEGGEGCPADLRHAYQGTERTHPWLQPNLPVETATGSDLLLGEYLDGVCGE